MPFNLTTESWTLLRRACRVKAEVKPLQARSSLPLRISVSVTPCVGQRYITQSRQEGKGSSCKWYFHTVSFSLLAFLLRFPLWVLYFPSHREVFYLNPSEFISGSLWGKHLPHKARGTDGAELKSVWSRSLTPLSSRWEIWGSEQRKESRGRRAWGLALAHLPFFFPWLGSPPHVPDSWMNSHFF